MKKTKEQIQQHECGNCGWTGSEEQLGCVLADVPHLAERLDPGQTVPSGECPKCGALAYPVEHKELEIVVNVSGGLVTDVYSTSPKIEVHVMDWDAAEEDDEYLEEHAYLLDTKRKQINRHNFAHEIW